MSEKIDVLGIVALILLIALALGGLEFSGTCQGNPFSLKASCGPKPAPHEDPQP
jgi:hypothetical protein